jgi:hypothetical protein
MAQHDVRFEVPERPVGNADIVFRIKKNGVQFGRLKISKGAAVWLPGKKSKAYRLSWDQLDRLAREHGRAGYFPI